jgi:hypothetical protein
MPAARDVGALPFCGGTVLVPRRDRRAAITGMAMAAPSRPVVVGLHQLVHGTFAVVGARWLTAPEGSVWPAWIGDERGAALLDDLSGAVSSFDGVAIHVPRQRGRRSVALLLLHGHHPVGFVKVKDDATSLDAEAAALAALTDGHPGQAAVPRLLARGGADVQWLVTTALAGPHRPSRQEPAAAYEAWLRERLAPVLPPAAVPPHWEPAHGDLAPWNLRRRGRQTWLVDWESAKWAPPGADRTYFRATASVLFGRAPLPAPAEAVEFWIEHVTNRGDADAALNQRLLGVLSDMARTGGRRRAGRPVLLRWATSLQPSEAGSAAGRRAPPTTSDG